MNAIALDKLWTVEAATEEMFRHRQDMRKALTQLRDKLRRRPNGVHRRVFAN